MYAATLTDDSTGSCFMEGTPKQAHRLSGANNERTMKDL